MLRSSFVFSTFVFVSFVLPAFAGSNLSQRQFIEQFKSPFMSMPEEGSPLFADNPGRYPASLHFLLESVLGWVPTGQVKVVDDACSPEVWGRRLQDPRIHTNVQLQGALVQKYFRDCEKELSTGTTSTLMNGLRMMTMKFNPQGHPFMRRVVFNMPGGVKLKGLLGLKGDTKKRPLVIIRLGIFANVEEFMPERAWIMMLFEQSPFNVLVVENMTSSDFIENNSKVSFGGYDEGLQNIILAKRFSSASEPISSLIDSIHFFGVSLGGHGVLFASLLNDLNSPGDKPLINSFSLMCPVVNLKPSMESLKSSGFNGMVADIWSEHRLAPLVNKFPALKKAPMFHFMENAIGEMMNSYSGGLSYIPNVRLPEGMKDTQFVWEQNNFWPYYKNVKEPVLIFATHEDPAVNFKLNSQEIQNKTLKIASNNIRVVDLPEGVHCTLPIPYDWNAISTLLQSYVLSHSPGFKTTERKIEMDLSEEWPADFFTSSMKTSFKMDWPSKDKNFVNLEVDARNGDGKEKSFAMSLPLSEFDYFFRNKELSKSEQQMMTRWLNQNVKVQIQNKNLKILWPVL
jgi:hypothetical protein